MEVPIRRLDAAARLPAVPRIATTKQNHEEDRQAPRIPGMMASAAGLISRSNRPILPTRRGWSSPKPPARADDSYRVKHAVGVVVSDRPAARRFFYASFAPR